MVRALRSHRRGHWFESSYIHMENIEWILKIIKENKGKYKFVACPYLKNNKCSIYEKRFSCCRNYPKTSGYCSDSDCAILKKKIRNNSEQSGKECAKCKAGCCKKILYPKNRKVTKRFVAKLMDIDCTACKKLFK